MQYSSVSIIDYGHRPTLQGKIYRNIVTKNFVIKLASISKTNSGKICFLCRIHDKQGPRCSPALPAVKKDLPVINY